MTVSNGRKAYVPPPATPERVRMNAHYDKERAKAKASGRTVKQLRRGEMGGDEARKALAGILAKGAPYGLRLARNDNGEQTVALPDGRLVDCRLAYLRKFGIYCGRISGTAYYAAGEEPRRDRMSLKLRREPDNEFDKNAIALLRGKDNAKVGYVAKGTAKVVAPELDAGTKLVGHVIRKGQYILISTPEIWSELITK